MVLVNTTFAVSPSADCDFREWVKSTFIQNAISGGGFTAPLFSRIMADEPDCAASYAVQFIGSGIEKSKQWMESGDGSRQLRLLRHSLGDNVLWFSTYMEIIE